MPRPPLAHTLTFAAAACSTPARQPPTPPPPRPPAICASLSDDACQDRLLDQSLCLADPAGPPCAALRAQHWLPPAPPPLASFLRCWRVLEPRDDVPITSLCLGEHDVAIYAAGAWDVWPHTGWDREDTTRHAGWTATVPDRRTLWLAAVRDGGGDNGDNGGGDGGTVALHVSDGAGLSARLTDRGGLDGELETQRRALPPLDRVCAAARACAAALPRPPLPPSDAEIEIVPTAEEEQAAAALTLRECLAAWQAASDRAERELPRAALPPACGTVAAADDGAWWSQVEPPW